MGHGLNRGVVALLLGFLLALAGCAGGTSSKRASTPLEAAEQSCGRAADSRGDVTPCDRYVALAEQSGDWRERHDAYSSRSIYYQMRGDLVAALQDADRAIEAWPTSPSAQGWRAVLMMESGDYENALAKFEALRTIDDEPLWYAEMATLEYVVGDRAQASELFRNATSLLDLDTHDLEKEAYFRFNAAIIESEIEGGDLAPIRAVDAAKWKHPMLRALRKHRLGEFSDADMRRIATEVTGSLAVEASCLGHFSIAHRNVISGDKNIARAEFQHAVESCKTYHFEFHAAKAWLKQLGA